MLGKHLVFVSDLGHTGPIWPQILDGVADAGWRITIVSPKMSRAQKRFFYLNYSERRWQLIETEDFRSPYRRFAGYPRILRRVLQFYAHLEVLKNSKKNKFADPYSEWKDRALQKLARIYLDEPFDFLLSSSSPFISHLIAREFSMSHKVKWVADYRDMWSLNHTLIEFDKYQVRFEQEILSHATACTTTSEGFKKTLSQIFRGEILVIHNGFDMLFCERNFSSKTSWQIVYPGQIYEDLQDIRPLLRVMKLLNEGKLNPIFTLLVTSYAVSHVKNVAREIGVLDTNWLQFGPVLPLKKSLALQRRADLLLLLNCTNPKVEGWMQTKLYEYIASGIPFIAIGGGTYDESSTLISDTKTGFVLRDETDILNFLQSFSKEGPPKLTRNLNKIMQLSRNEQGKKLAAFLDNLT